MKNLFNLFAIAFLCFFSTSTFAQQEKKITHNNGYAMVDVTSSSMDQLEQQMFNEMNLVRSDPKGYKQHVTAYMTANNIVQGHQYYNDAQSLLADLDSLSTNIAANKIPKRTVLKPNDCLFKTARIHAEDQGATGDLNHNNPAGVGPGKRIANTCSQEFDEWISKGNSSVGNGQENIEGGTGAVNVRNSNINLLIDGGLGPAHGHRWAILRPESTHATAFFYKDHHGSEVWNRWIQMFAIDKATATAIKNASSNNQSSNNSNAIPADSADCKCNGSMGQDTSGAYYCDENGTKTILTKGCYDKINSNWGN